MDQLSAVKLLALSTAFSLGGYHVALSQSSIPSLYNLPASASLPAFRNIYMVALKQCFLPIAPISLGCFAYLAYNSEAKRNRSQAILYGSSAAFVLGIGLVTKLIMLPGVEKLLDMNDNLSHKGFTNPHATVDKLLRSFAAQNWLRAACGMTAGLLGAYALLMEHRMEASLK